MAGFVERHLGNGAGGGDVVADLLAGRQELQRQRTLRGGNRGRVERQAGDAEAAEAALAQLAKANQGQQPQQQTEAPVSADVPNQPLANIQTIQDLQRLHRDATEAVRFAEYNLDKIGRAHV